MTPARIENATTVLGAPAGWEDQTDLPCAGLPVRVDIVEGMPCLVSAWTPLPEEIAAIVAGGAVILHIFQDQHPVVALGVSRPPEPA